jgi:predicted acetyltransferase
MPSIDLEVAGAVHFATIGNLIQLYVHDFTEFWAGTDRAELQDDGRYLPFPGLERYWSEPDRTPWLIRSDRRLIGFALIDKRSHSGAALDGNIGEFFIVRKYRRSGYGSAPLAAILNDRPGRWEAAVARANVGALAFWRRALARNVQVSAVEEVDVEDDEWNGPVLRFVVAERGQ